MINPATSGIKTITMQTYVSVIFLLSSLVTLSSIIASLFTDPDINDKSTLEKRLGPSEAKIVSWLHRFPPWFEPHNPPPQDNSELVANIISEVVSVQPPAKSTIEPLILNLIPPIESPVIPKLEISGTKTADRVSESETIDSSSSVLRQDALPGTNLESILHSASFRDNHPFIQFQYVPEHFIVKNLKDNTIMKIFTTDTNLMKLIPKSLLKVKDTANSSISILDQDISLVKTAKILDNFRDSDISLVKGRTKFLNRLSLSDNVIAIPKFPLLPLEPIKSIPLLASNSIKPMESYQGKVDDFQNKIKPSLYIGPIQSKDLTPSIIERYQYTFYPNKIKHILKLNKEAALKKIPSSSSEIRNGDENGIWKRFQ